MSDDRLVISRAYRRLGFGVAGGTLDAIVGAGLPAARAALLSPDEAGVVPAPALYATDYTVLPEEPNTRRKELALRGISELIGQLITSPRTHTEWLMWSWHGHFVVAQPEVRNPQFMVNNLLLLRSMGGGAFADLLIEVTKDPAMLLYLDGNDNQKEAPNENYSRELKELFALGIGSYTEDDVDSGASALTGWKIDRDTRQTRLFKDRHDTADQPYLGVEVDDLGDVVGALMAQPALPRFIAQRLGRQIIGPGITDETISAAAAAFTASGFQVAALIGHLADALLAGADAGPLLIGPLPWYVMACRATGAAHSPDRLELLDDAGQLPWFCPSVAGWPFNDGWSRSSTHVGRFNIAALVAATTPADSTALAAAAAGDNAALGWALGLGADFSATSWTAITTPPDAHSRLTLALVSPEFIHA